jgi:hypothetical protein
MFYSFNFSVGLYAPDKDRQYVVIQSEGTFLGVTKAVNQPLICRANSAEKSFTCNMPTQAEMISAMEKMPPVQPGRTKPEEKFIDACRTHPYFKQKKKNGEFEVRDKNILKIYDEVVRDMNRKCAVKETMSRWRIHEDYPYLVADYSLKTRVNIEAIVPPSLRFVKGIVQIILNAVSVQYVPLSMKNFRDLTQKWTKTGVPQ